MNESQMNILILLAAGQSKRAKQNKLQVSLHGKSLWKVTLDAYSSHPEINQIILVVPPGQSDQFKCEAKLVDGGDTRMQSFKNALDTLSFQDTDIILDHNAASPSVTAKEISAVIAAAKEHGAAAVSQQAVDTLIEEEDGFYAKVLNRDHVRLMQTPQAVRGDILKSLKLDEATDLTSALLATAKVKVVDASPSNKKVTFEEDLAVLRSNSFIGEDSHHFSEGGTLILGGLEIPEHAKLEANSDGDVIFHAIGRALAQAKGANFSKVADELCEAGERNSAAYLEPLLTGITIHRVSIQIECKTPRIDDLPIAASIAKVLNIAEEKISVEAMSGEGLTEPGKGKGIRVSCILTIR